MWGHRWEVLACQIFILRLVHNYGDRCLGGDGLCGIWRHYVVVIVRVFIFFNWCQWLWRSCSWPHIVAHVGLHLNFNVPQLQHTSRGLVWAVPRLLFGHFQCSMNKKEYQENYSGYDNTREDGSKSSR